MKVALITRVGIEGDWEYSRNLYENIKKDHTDIDIDVIEAGDLNTMVAKTRAHDVVYINFVFGMPYTGSGDLRRFGKKIVLTFNENNPQDNMNSHPFLREADIIVAHEKNRHGFVHIPHGIPVVDPCRWSPDNNGIGTAGFPFADKNIEAIAGAGALLRQYSKRFTMMNIVAPASGHANTWIVKQKVASIFGFDGLNYVTDFLNQDTVLAIISKNLVNVFAPNSRRLGPSGSVRLGLATGSHLVLNRSMMFRDLFEYEDEIEFVEGESGHVTSNDIAQAVTRVIVNGKRPKRVLEEGSWKVCAAKYADCFRSLV